MADVSREYLMRKGLPVKLENSGLPGAIRVLVGPLKDDEELNRYKTMLEEAGFRPFLKKY